jgi:murein DD-endopeptidase MepM/ murein hydrolase activator NlpD
VIRSGVPQHTATGHRAWIAVRAAIVAISIIALLGIPSSVGAESLSDRIAAARARQNSLNRDIARQNRLLEALEKDAAVARGAIAATDRILGGINADQQALRVEIRAARDALKKVRARRAKLQEQLLQSDETLDMLELEIRQGELELEARRESLNQRLAEAYRTSNTSLLEQVFGAESFADVLSDASAYMTLSEQDSQIAKEIEDEQAAIDSLRAVTSATKYRKDQLRRATMAAADDISVQRGKLNTAMAQYKRLEQKYKKIRAKQAARARRIAGNRRQAAAYMRRQAAARRQLNSHIKGLVRQAQAKANRWSGGGTPGSSGNGRFMWPTSGTVTQEYGCTGFRLEPPSHGCAHFHSGIDIANNSGTRIMAAGDGVVAFVGWNKYDGSNPAFIVMIAHGNNINTFYSHLLPRYVVRGGQRVRKGQLIGYMGATGNATGPHLHWEVMRGYSPLPPRAWT